MSWDPCFDGSSETNVSDLLRGWEFLHSFVGSWYSYGFPVFWVEWSSLSTKLMEALRWGGAEGRKVGVKFQWRLQRFFWLHGSFQPQNWRVNLFWFFRQAVIRWWIPTNETKLFLPSSWLPLSQAVEYFIKKCFWRARLGEIQGDVMWCTWWPFSCSVESNKLREVAATCRLWFQYIGKHYYKCEDEPLFCRFFVLTPSKSDLLCWHRYLSTHLQDFNREPNQTITNPTWHLWVFNATVTAIYCEPNNAI